MNKDEIEYAHNSRTITLHTEMKLVKFWKKMFVNNNTILYSLSRLIRDRFASVASEYGTLSLAQSVSNIKQVVWNSFIMNIRF